jgi:two-component system, chemotaxis family, CheB/CheR fusion protein
MTEPPYPIVAIGASAGGLEALRQFFAQVSPDSGMAFVVIQHLDPGRPSLLTSVLASDARMPVVEVTQGMRAEPQRIHVIPPGADLGVEHGVLSLIPRLAAQKLHLPIDTFFRALAQDQKSHAIGIVLSGSGSDGAEGLRAIKAEGGLTFAQDAESAQFPSMPDSAAAAGVVDRRGSPTFIAHELAKLSSHPYRERSEGSAPLHAESSEPSHGEDAEPPRSTDARPPPSADIGPSSGEDAEPPPSEAIRAEGETLNAILKTLAERVRVDFSGYKRPTLLRRVGRRMALRHVTSLEAYERLLHDDPSEAGALAEDMLIHVTSFFRDPAAFEALKERALPALIARQEAGQCLRAWVPGCSTGEEAYAIVICLLELFEAQGRDLASVSIKLFATDLSDAAILTARRGIYPDTALAGVSPARRAQFFERTEGGHRVSKVVRDGCVFVRHDLTRDPPFAKLDLISCRNVLIYFDTGLQRRILPMLHHCLNDAGVLFLGSSEAVTGFEDLYSPLDKEHRLFSKMGESPRLSYPPPFGHDAESKLLRAPAVTRLSPARDAQKQADHFLLARYAPPGVVVNEQLEVVSFRGHTGDFLESAPGQPQSNVLRMAREGLVAHLREALEKARTESVAVHKPALRIGEGASQRRVDLEVVPLPGSGEALGRYFLILFHDAADKARSRTQPLSPSFTPDNKPSSLEEALHLRAELIATRDYLQSIIGEHQEATQELANTNQELHSTNQELQSTNEELESAKEELQSTNEEIITVNDELQERNREIDRVASDLANVLESVEIPLIIVDQNLAVRRFTPSAQHISSLLPVDIGRSIDDVKLKLEVDNLADRIRETLQANAVKEWEVQGLGGSWFRLQIRPYRTADQRLDGAILSFIDVNALKRVAEEAEAARDYARGIVEAVPLPLLVLDEQLCVVSANSAFHESFAIRLPETEGARFFELLGGVWDVPSLRAAVENGLAGRGHFREIEIQRDIPMVGRRDLLLAGRPITSASGTSMLLLVIDDVTERRMLENSEEQARVEAEQANRAKDLFLATLSHELRTPLSTILISAQVLQRTAARDPKILKASAAIERAVGNQTRLVDDLLDISRIVSGKLMLDLTAVDLTQVVQAAVDVARSAAETKKIGLDLIVHGTIGTVYGDASRLQQVFTNLLNNSIKFTPRGGKIDVCMDSASGQAEIVIKDNGIGIATELLPYLFDRFVQAEGSMTRAHGGLGLGLAIVRHLVTVHGGEVHAESAGEGRGGATFRVRLPLSVSPVLRAPRLAHGGVDGVRVLLIEDDDDTRESFAMMLETLGAEVREATSAAFGLAAVESFQPQVIVCDIAMPVEDGFDFIRSLRSLSPERGGQTPVAALTALAGEADRRRVLDAGFQMHLPKPIDAQRLASAVGNLSVWGDPAPDSVLPSTAGLGAPQPEVSDA